MQPTEIKVHPIAALFPMLSDDELADLAEDIKANGLLHPIVLDDDGAIVDGRNRHKACGIAGIEPRFERLNGHDAITFILSQNIARRHMTKGQQAVLVARTRLVESTNGSEGEIARAVGISRELLNHALTILDWAPDLADNVILGGEKFERTYQVARDRKAAASSAEAQLRRLWIAAPDLATRVVEEQMDLAEALGALRVRQQREAEAKRATSQLADTMLAFLDTGSAATVDERAADILATLDASVLSSQPDFSVARFRRCVGVLAAVADGIQSKEAPRGNDAVPVE